MAIDIQDLIIRGERPGVDFKAAMAFDGDAKFDLAKDIMAMANNRDGGALVIGIKQDKQSGSLTVEGLSDKELKTFDVTDVAKFVRKYATPMVKLEVSTQTHASARLIVISVAEFDVEPIICAKATQNSAQKPVLAAGAVYVRTLESSTEQIKDAALMRDLMTRAARKNRDSLLADISQLLNRPDEKARADPFEPEARFATGRIPCDEEATFEQWNEGDLIAYEVRALEPGKKDPGFPGLEEIAEASSVTLRGWGIPVVPNTQRPSRLHSGTLGLDVLTCDTDRGRHKEQWLLFESGYFQIRRRFAEDQVTGDNLPTKKWFDPFYAIAELTEFAAFAIRFAGVMESDAMAIRVRYQGLGGRRLWTADQARNHTWDVIRRSARQNNITLTEHSTVASGRADPASLILRPLRKLLSFFGLDWDDSRIRSEITPLLERAHPTRRF